MGEEGPAGGGGGGGQQAATGRAAQISIPDRPAGEIYRTGELKRPCTQEKESPVNRLSVILFGAVPILPAPALPGCGTGVSSSVPPPQQLGNPSAGHKRASAGRRLCRAQCYRGQCPPRCPPPRDGDFEAAPPPQALAQIVPWPHSQWDGLSRGGDPCSKLLEVPSLLGVTPSQCRHKPGHPRG